MKLPWAPFSVSPNARSTLLPRQNGDWGKRWCLFPVHSQLYDVLIFRFVNICWCPNYLFSQRMKEVKENGSTNQRQNKIENDMAMGPRNRSLPVFTWRCQDANTIVMYGLSKLFTIKFLLVFNILKYSFCNIMNFFPSFYDGWRDMSVVVTYWTDVMFYEETVSTKWNHEQHETMSMEGTTIQR